MGVRVTPNRSHVDQPSITRSGRSLWILIRGSPLRAVTTSGRKIQDSPEITGSNIGDAPILPDLLGQIPAGEEISSVTADGAYDTRKCHEAIAARNAAAVIPPRKNAKPWKPTSPGAVARNEALRASNYLGRSIWRQWSGYHRRSRVESKMNCIKLLGQSLMARDFDRQVAELQVRIAVLNGYTALGIPVTVAVE